MRVPGRSGKDDSMLTWDDPDDIAFELMDANPDVDPLDLNFVDLHRWSSTCPSSKTTQTPPTSPSSRRSSSPGMPSSEEATIGLFPLGLVLLPGEQLPLHIFEERYKRLIGECRQRGRSFGVVLYHDQSVAEHGCTAELIEVLEEFEDGRLNIVVEGRDRFQLLELIAADEDDEAAYLEARVEYYDDLAPEDGLADDASGATTRSGALGDEAATLFRRMVGLMGVDEPRVPRGEAPLSFRLGAAIDFGPPLKQRLLESRVEDERLDLLVTVMKALIPGLELRKQRKEAIGGNGKGS